MDMQQLEEHLKQAENERRDQLKISTFSDLDQTLKHIQSHTQNKNSLPPSILKEVKCHFLLMLPPIARILFNAANKSNNNVSSIQQQQLEPIIDNILLSYYEAKDKQPIDTFILVLNSLHLQFDTIETELTDAIDLQNLTLLKTRIQPLKSLMNKILPILNNDDLTAIYNKINW